MTRTNRYKSFSRISEAKFRQLLKLFCLDLTAVQITEITLLNRNTVNRYLKNLRQRIAHLCEQESPFSGEVEVDESWFGARRVKGKRGRGAYGKTIVFGIFQRNGNVVYRDSVKLLPEDVAGRYKRKGWVGVGHPF